jgi:SAM-dependent methyltransferase
VPHADPADQRAESREGWERAAAGWGAAADSVRRWSAGVSATMVDALALQPGERVVELAAGPGDTGFMAAELIAPGGTLICSDGAEAMLAVARERAAAQGIANVEFRRLELEWIDLPTADVDAVLCRWGIMLVVDPAAAAQEIRRILKPGGRAALAVWDVPERNPWTTLPTGVMRQLGHIAPPPADAPGMFALAAEGALRELLEAAGLVDVTVLPVAMERRFGSVDAYLAETIEVSFSLRAAYEALGEGDRAAVRERLAAAALPYTAEDGGLVLPGSTLVAVASA